MSLFASPFSIPIVAILGVFLWLIVQAVVSSVQSIVKHRNEIELKQTLVQRGMSADEIERIIQATSVVDPEDS